MLGSCCKIHEQLGQLFYIVEQLSSTAPPANKKQNSRTAKQLGQLFDIGLTDRLCGQTRYEKMISGEIG